MVKSQLAPSLLLSRDREKRADYFQCIVKSIQKKVSKAQSYAKQRDLILAVYLNEFVDLEPMGLENFVREHPAFQNIAPFALVVFSGIGNGVVYPTAGASG